MGMTERVELVQRTNEISAVISACHAVRVSLAQHPFLYAVRE
jgi:hypothetical protein